MSTSQLRHLPPVGSLLEDPRVAALAAGPRRGWVTRVVQDEVDAARARLLKAGEAAATSREDLVEDLVVRVEAAVATLLRPAMRRVVNATGVVVHTNLGRSLLPPRARDLMLAAAAHPLDLEVDLDSARRGHRGRGVERKLALLAGAEDALIVNNNAAALWLAVRACAGPGGRVVLSRGEVVAIGGSFRLHEILAEAGCDLAEVGTTNRTAVADYAAALKPGAVVLKVHRSNFAVTGFSEEASLAELAALCRERGHTLIYDAGSGLLHPLEPYGLTGERTLAQDVAAGPDLVTCSGDKLLGGVQAGFAIGRRDLVDAMRGHPLRRALRVDKLTLAACDGVLTHYLADEAPAAVPTLALIARGLAELEAMAGRACDALAPHTPPGWTAEIVPAEASVGGGSFSDAVLPTRLLRWRGPKAELERCHVLLRRSDPALLARIGQDGLALDFRALTEEDVELSVAVVREAWTDLAARPDDESEESR